MLHLVKKVIRAGRWTARIVIGRPRTAFVLVGLAVASAGSAGLLYARHERRAAVSALASDRPDEARSRLALCLRVWPRSPEVHLLAARAERLSGDVPAAEAHLTRCLDLEDGATEAVQLEFLLCRVQRGEVDEVAGTLIATVEQGHPDGPMILETLARAYLISLRYKPAYGCLSRWIDLRPDAAKAYLLRGWVLERLNNHKAAMQDYLRALDHDPDLIPARLRVAEMLMEDKQAPDALPHLEQLFRQAPALPEVQARLGICRFLQGNPGEARRLMEAAVAHLPSDPVLLIHLARLDLQDGRYAAAEGRLRKVLESDPTDTEAWYTLVSVLRLQGRAAEAAAAMAEHDASKVRVDRVNKLLQDVADSPTARADDYAEIGEMMLHINKERLGLYWLDRALERDPGNQRSHQALAAYFDKKGEPAKAASHRRRLAPPPTKNGGPPRSFP